MPRGGEGSKGDVYQVWGYPTQGLGRVATAPWSHWPCTENDLKMALSPKPLIIEQNGENFLLAEGVAGWGRVQRWYVPSLGAVGPRAGAGQGRDRRRVPLAMH